MFKKLVTMTNNKIKWKSRYTDCTAIKSFSEKTKHKSELEIFASQFSIDWIL